MLPGEPASSALGPRPQRGLPGRQLRGLWLPDGEGRAARGQDGDFALRALLNSGDEMLLPSPDYPLWSASVSLNHGSPVYYNCRPGDGFVPDPDEISSLVTPRTRAVVLINPNNPTGAVYPRATLEAIAGIAGRHQLIVFADEIYDQMLYAGARHVPLATLVPDTLCATFGGLSKIYRACGYRVGWVVFSGDREQAADYLHAVELLASLRLHRGKFYGQRVEETGSIDLQR